MRTASPQAAAGMAAAAEQLVGGMRESNQQGEGDSIAPLDDGGHDAAAAAAQEEKELNELMAIDAGELRDPLASGSDADSDGSAGAAPRAARRNDTRPRKTSRRAIVQAWLPIGQFATEEEKEEKLMQLANIECAGGAWGNGKPGKGWKQRRCKVSGRPQVVRVRNCCFQTESSCPARVREIQFMDGAREWLLERYDLSHFDHSVSHRSRGVKLATTLLLRSPSKMALSNKEALKVVRRQSGALTEQQQKSIVQKRKHLKKEEQHKIVPADAAGRFSGVNIFVDSRRKAALQAAGKFGMHTSYVCGEPWIDAEQQTINIAFSTQNLLLNAYRQELFGVPPILQVDTTHRLVLEGHNNMLFGTQDVAQHFHIIGYGICNKEDTAAHEHIMRCLAHEAEALVAEHRLAQMGV